MIKRLREQAELEKAVSSHGDTLVLVNFFSMRNSLCTSFMTVYEVFSQQYPQLTFVQVDVNISTDIAEQYKINSLPVTQFYKNGQKVDEVIGANEENLRRKIEEHK